SRLRPAMLVPALLILLVMVSLSVSWSWTVRTRLLARLRAQWGEPRDRPRDMDAVSDFFRSPDAASTSLDARTGGDLLMDNVFAHVDRTESSVGQQLLYHRLRSAPRSLEAFDPLIGRAEDDVALREQAQASLARLQDSSGYYLHHLARPDAL